MPFSKLGWYGTLVALFVFVLGGCDAPTGEPSINTDTSIDAPLVSEKTFSFLGGDESEFEPLIDTTTSEFDSLFVVGDEPKDISIEQEVDNFDIGSLEGALDEAAGDLSVSDRFEETLIGNGDLIRQEISATYNVENQLFTGPEINQDASFPATSGGNEVTIPFPIDRLPPPDFGTVDATGADVDSIRTTESTESEVNEIKFVLENNSISPTDSLTDGDGNAPVVQIEDTEGDFGVLRERFERIIPPGESESITLDVADYTLGTSTQYRLTVGSNGGDTNASLSTTIFPLEYQRAILSQAGNVEISASEQGLTAQGGDSNFEGMNAGSGNVNLGIDRGGSDLGAFNTEVDYVEIGNEVDSIAAFARDNIESNLFVGNPDQSGIEMADRDIANTINVDSLTASPTSDVAKFSADDVYTISIDGTVRIQTLYFRPDGETVQTEGSVSIESDQVDIQSGDFVEVSNAFIETEELDLQPDIAFDTLTFNYPDLRRGPDFRPEDSLQIRLVQNPDPNDPFEFDVDQLQEEGFRVQLDENLRIQPDVENTVQFRASGRLVDADEVADPEDAEGIASAGDGISATTRVEDFGIQEIDVSEANRFTVNVTTDENGDNQLDLADDAEAETASFDGFEGVAGRIDGLELESTSLDFSIETENLASTDVGLFAAIQGKNDTESIFLAGQPRTERGVSSNPFETAFVDGGDNIAPDSLINLGVDLEDANLGEPVQRTKSIDDGNSNVADFINTLPTEIRFAGQAEMNTDEGDLRVRNPVKLDAGFTLDVPLQIRDTFIVRDTIDADFSDLEDLTDPEEDLNISTAQLRFRYTNGLPLGADVEMVAVDANGNEVRTFSSDDLRLKPAPKNSEGAAEGEASGEFVFTLGDTQEDLRALANGREIQLVLNMTQESSGPAARLRADDTISLNMRLNVEASINTGG